METASLPLPRPLLLGPRVTDWLIARGAVSGTQEVASLLRGSPSWIEQASAAALEAGCDVVFAATDCTTPYALAESGNAFRAAALTARAVEIALQASALSAYPVAVAGIIGAGVPPKDASHAFGEHVAHAERLALAGVHILVAEAPHLKSLREVVRASLPTRLPTWATVPVNEDGRAWGQHDLAEAAASLEGDGASTLLLVAPTVAAASAALLAVVGLPRMIRLTRSHDFEADVGILLPLGARGIGGPAHLDPPALLRIENMLRPRRPSGAPPRPSLSVPPPRISR